MTGAKQRRKITLAALIVALGAAIYLNWQYSDTDNRQFETAGTPVLATDEVLETQEDINKNYGDAQLVSAPVSTQEDYFESAELKRTKTRDSALDKLQKALKNAQLTDEEKKQLTDELSVTVTAMTAEVDIENMVCAKGFSKCLAFIDQDKVSVSVSTGGQSLTKAQVAQIRDIVLSKLDVQAKNISIVEVK